jgi:hypothetical protein
MAPPTVRMTDHSKQQYHINHSDQATERRYGPTLSAAAALAALAARRSNNPPTDHQDNGTGGPGGGRGQKINLDDPTEPNDDDNAFANPLSFSCRVLCSFPRFDGVDNSTSTRQSERRCLCPALETAEGSLKVSLSLSRLSHTDRSVARPPRRMLRLAPTPFTHLSLFFFSSPPYAYVRIACIVHRTAIRASAASSVSSASSLPIPRPGLPDDGDER